MKYDIYKGAKKIKDKPKKTLFGMTALVMSFGLVLTAVMPVLANGRGGGNGGGHGDSSYVVVTPGNNQGWAFNPDPTNATPYEFTDEEASIGQGSLYVKPIGATSAHKFIALRSMGIPVADLNSIAYDFMIAGSGDASDANQFYLNIYTNLPSSSTYYDCRFDYVPTSGSTLNFMTASFNATDTATNVDDRFDGSPREDDGYNCPTTLAQMAIDQPGSTISGFTLNLGDTSNSDTGIAGYFDKVVVNTTGNVTTYDFELYANRTECKAALKEDRDEFVRGQQADRRKFMATHPTGPEIKAFNARQKDERKAYHAQWMADWQACKKYSHGNHDKHNEHEHERAD